MDNSNSKILLNRAIKILDYANMEYSLQMLCKMAEVWDFRKNIRIKIEDIGCTHCIPSQSNDKVHLHQESVWEQE